ncbi:hypothetical protein LTS18_007673 [Coniosporium uncinatum]|uniref:Uncharacterized protein n=1 Tax=Coniosporium uncinatum TaxID=93489 RepID=A0ACC3DX89_9PEZI|nr:hypothetical protein LTS18_007673 [Coniosporium uncinatum]
MTNPPRDSARKDDAQERNAQQERGSSPTGPTFVADFGGEESGGFRDSEDTHYEVQKPDSKEDTGDAEKQHQIPLLYTQTLLLARYDTSYDLRDRARLYKALLAIPSSTELATLLLLAPKPVPRMPSPSEARKGLVLGSASLVVGDEGGVGGVRGYEGVPEWVEDGHEPDGRLREDGSGGGGGVMGGGAQKGASASEMLEKAARERGLAPAATSTVGSFGGGGKMGGKANGVGKEKTLDDWLAESEGEGEGESEEDESEEETEEESEEKRKRRIAMMTRSIGW